MRKMSCKRCHPAASRTSCISCRSGRCLGDLLFTELDEMSTDIWDLRRSNRQLSFNFKESEASLARVLEELRLVKKQNELLNSQLSESQRVIQKLKEGNIQIQAENVALWKTLQQASNNQIFGIRDNLNNFKRIFSIEDHQR